MACRTYRWKPERKAEVEAALKSSLSRAEAARKLHVSTSSLSHACEVYGFDALTMLAVEAKGPIASEQEILRRRVRALEKENVNLREAALTEEIVKREILKLSDAPTEAPSWLTDARRCKSSSPGIPMMEVSDEHWGEVIDPAQIGGVNAYDMGIARRRLKALGENALDLLFNHTVNPKYPGMVLAFLGDGTTGDIHEELTATNEVEIMPAVLDLRDHRVAFIDQLLANGIERIFAPCVTGNHGRNTPKIREKGRAYTSFDWLGYQMLVRHYAGNDRVRFMVPSDRDALFSVYGHRYLATHGDALGKGGDGIIGAIGPIFRGDTKKRARNAQIDRAYDTLLCGHWHQRIALQRIIVNGSLKGYDEYAAGWNFSYEPPQQNLWLSHPEYGPTIAMPVFVERGKHQRPTSNWIEWK